MTTIAYRAGTLAADSLGARGSIRTDGRRKIQRLDGAIIAFSGTVSDGLAFTRWWAAGRDQDNLPRFRPNGHSEDNRPDFHALVLTEDGLSRWWEDFNPEPVDDEFFAIGSGAMAATAAMHMGADAVEAVRIAALVDIYTGGEILAMRLDEGGQ